MNLCTECAESTLTCTMSECKKLCYHMYECDQLCYDYTNGHLCKHIHRVHTIRLLETNEDNKDVQSESVCMPNTCELIKWFWFWWQSWVHWISLWWWWQSWVRWSLRNPTTGEKNDTSLKFINSIQFIYFLCTLFTCSIVYFYLLYVFVQIHQSNFRHFSHTWNSWKKLWLWRTHLFTAFYPTSIHFYTVGY